MGHESTGFNDSGSFGFPTNEPLAKAMTTANQSTDRTWRPVRPSEGVLWLSALSVPWWVAGGWALDLFTGNQSRPHKDFDVGILRRNVLQALAQLPSWEFFEAKEGVLTKLGAGAAPRADVHSLWGRSKDSARWELEMMLDEADADDWVFRRAPAIRRSLTMAIRYNSDGIPYFAPEIQLLYKARAPRALDQADFVHIVPRLDLDARCWLRDAISTTDPGHTWLSVLSATEGHV